MENREIAHFESIYMSERVKNALEEKKYLIVGKFLFALFNNYTFVYKGLQYLSKIFSKLYTTDFLYVRKE